MVKFAGIQGAIMAIQMDQKWDGTGMRDRPLECVLRRSIEMLWIFG